MRSILSLAFVFSIFLQGCIAKVEWEDWKAEGSPPVIDGVQIIFQTFPTSYGLASGGHPHRIRLRAIGKIGIHESLTIQSIEIRSSRGEEIRIKDQINKDLLFVKIETIEFEDGEHGIDIGFTDQIPFEYYENLSLTITADISIQSQGIKIRKQIIQKFTASKIDGGYKFINILFAT